MKKLFKIFLLCTLVSFNFFSKTREVHAFTESERIENGLSFSNPDDTYDTLKALSSIPQTFEAYIKVPTSISSRTGIIFGNFESDAIDCFSFEIQWGNNVAYPKLFYNENTVAGTISINFSNVDVRNDNYIHLAITHDTTFQGNSGNQYTVAKCYINGELKQSVNVNATANILNYYENFNYEVTSKVRVGGDYRPGNAQYFKGNIKSIEVYSDVRTESEILNDYRRLLSSDPTDENLLAGYNFTKEGKAYLKDISSNGYNLISSNEEYSDVDGLSFNENTLYRVNKNLNTLPYSFETEILLPPSYSSRGGVIFGNYGISSSLSIEIATNGVPRLFFTNSENIDKSIFFYNVDVRTGDFAHLTITIDKNNKQFNCYLNGVLGETSNDYFEYKNEIINNSFILGGDNRAGNVQYFKGYIKSFTAFTDLRTSTEVMNDYLNGVDVNTDNLLLHYEVDKSDISNDILDLSNNHYNIDSQMTWFDNNKLEKDYDYSFAVVGDTQIVNWKTPEHMNTIYDWILSNQVSKNIQHVFGLGDITQSWGTQEQAQKEWRTAKNAISKMDGKLSYSLVRGNHDNTKYFNDYFNYSGYTSQFAGFYEDNNISNSYMECTIGKTNYLFITLDYGASDDVLEWASEIVESYPNHKVIVSTHAYMYRDGTTLDENDVCPPGTSSDIDFVVPVDSRPNRQYNHGEELWDKFISQHGNIILVLSGHDPCNNVVTLQSEGIHGNIVTQMLIDPQGMDNDMGSTGMVAMLYFDENGDNMQVEFYSTIKNQYYKETNQYFVDMSKSGYSAHYYVNNFDDNYHWGQCDCGCIDKYVPHEFDEGVIIKNPSVTEEGERIYTCECGYQKTEKINKLEADKDDIITDEDNDITDDNVIIDENDGLIDKDTYTINDFKDIFIVVLSVVGVILVVGIFISIKRKF